MGILDNLFGDSAAVQNWTGVLGGLGVGLGQMSQGQTVDIQGHMRRQTAFAEKQRQNKIWADYLEDEKRRKQELSGSASKIAEGIAEKQAREAKAEADRQQNLHAYGAGLNAPSPMQQPVPPQQGMPGTYARPQGLQTSGLMVPRGAAAPLPPVQQQPMPAAMRGPGAGIAGPQQPPRAPMQGPQRPSPQVMRSGSPGVTMPMPPAPQQPRPPGTQGYPQAQVPQMSSQQRATALMNQSGVAPDRQAKILTAATKHGIPPAILAGMIKQESNFNPQARSGAGAEGLMQIMPATGRDLGLKPGEALDADKSLDAGARYLKQQFDKFGDWKTALQAYNAGPGTVRKVRAGEREFLQETKDYVPAIMKNAGLSEKSAKKLIKKGLSSQPLKDRPKTGYPPPTKAEEQQMSKAVASNKPVSSRLAARATGDLFTAAQLNLAKALGPDKGKAFLAQIAAKQPDSPWQIVNAGDGRVLAVLRANPSPETTIDLTAGMGRSIKAQSPIGKLIADFGGSTDNPADVKRAINMLKDVKRAGVANAPWPALEKGMTYRYDEDGQVIVGSDGIPVIVPMTGSIAARKEAEARDLAAREKQARDAGRGVKQRYQAVVSKDASRALKLIRLDREWLPDMTTGLSGWVFKQIPGSQAYQLNTYLNTVKANIGFDRLQQMRLASPTGGALGNISNLENMLLQATLGSLDQFQNVEELEFNLRRIKLLQETMYNPDGIAEDGYIRGGIHKGKNIHGLMPTAPGDTKSFEGKTYRFKGGREEDRGQWEVVE